jgi:hypothetical protein
MAKRKIEDEHRIFQDNWDIEFFCISGKKHDALYLICRKTINIQKRYNINCHYTTHHTELKMQGEKKLIPHMASKIFTFKEKLKMYIEKVS